MGGGGIWDEPQRAQSGILLASEGDEDADSDEQPKEEPGRVAAEPGS